MMNLIKPVERIDFSGLSKYEKLIFEGSQRLNGIFRLDEIEADLRKRKQIRKARFQMIERGFCISVLTPDLFEYVSENEVFNLTVARDRKIYQRLIDKRTFPFGIVNVSFHHFDQKYYNSQNQLMTEWIEFFNGWVKDYVSKKGYIWNG